MLDVLIRNFGLLLSGAGMTLYLSAASAAIASIGGMILALLRVFGTRPVSWAAEAYLYLVRGIPLIVLLFAMYYLLPYSGFDIDTMVGGILVIGMYFSAYMSEVFRSALQSVVKGQWDAGRALGMHGFSLLMIVILPQALRLAAPPFISTCIMLVKGTAVVSIIGLFELTMAGRQIVERTLAPFQILLGVAGIYFVICYGLSLIGRFIEARASHVA